jgi:hypothetical protein
VERVDEDSSLCVVRLDRHRRERRATTIGISGGGGDADDEVHVLLRPIHLASLEWVGRRAQLVDGSSTRVAGSVLGFDAAAGRYALQVAGGDVRQFDPQFLKLIESDDEEAADSSRDVPLQTNPLFRKAALVGGSTPAATGPAEDATTATSATESETAVADQPPGLDLAETAKAAGSAGAMQRAGEGAQWVAGEGALAARRAEEAARKAVLVAARQFANHPLGRVAGPVAGWLLLDVLGVCGWQVQRAHALGVMRRAVAVRGADRLSDVDLRRIAPAPGASPQHSCRGGGNGQALVSPMAPLESDGDPDFSSPHASSGSGL